MIDTVKDVVEHLGGRHAVAELLGITAEGVGNAIRRGTIPTPWHFKVISEAKRRKIKIAPDLFRPSKMTSAAVSEGTAGGSY